MDIWFGFVLFSATNNAAMNFLEINVCKSFSRPIVSMLFSHCNPSNKYILLYNSVHLYGTDGLLFIHFHGVELLLESRSYLEVYFQDFFGGPMFQENSIETCILSRVKQITSPGWMHETSARTWCTGKT